MTVHRPLAVAALCLALAIAAPAQVPQTMNYQLMLTDDVSIAAKTAKRAAIDAVLVNADWSLASAAIGEIMRACLELPVIAVTRRPVPLQLMKAVNAGATQIVGATGDNSLAMRVRHGSATRAPASPVATPPGLEPGMPEPKSGVLPITPRGTGTNSLPCRVAQVKPLQRPRPGPRSRARARRWADGPLAALAGRCTMARGPCRPPVRRGRPPSTAGRCPPRPGRRPLPRTPCPCPRSLR